MSEGTIKFACECGKAYKVPDSFAGKRVKCPACGKTMRELEDVTDAILRRSLDGNIAVVYIGADSEFEKAGKIGALLRFRADQAKSGKMAG